MITRLLQFPPETRRDVMREFMEEWRALDSDEARHDLAVNANVKIVVVPRFDDQVDSTSVLPYCVDVNRDLVGFIQWATIVGLLVCIIVILAWKL